MNNTSRKIFGRTLVSLMAVIALTGWLLNHQVIVNGSGYNTGSTAQPQSNLNAGDNLNFTNAGLKGTYAGVLSGTLVAGPVTGPTAVSYLYTADGNGNITDTDATVNINGQTFFNINFPGTYTVQANGRVSITVTPINGPLTGVPLLASSVVTETSGGKITELRGIDTTPGLVSTRVEKRIGK
jgi:hypothetical protein